MRDAAMPSHCNAITVAVFAAAAKLATSLPDAIPQVKTFLSSILASPALSSHVRRAGAEALLKLCVAESLNRGTGSSGSNNPAEHVIRTAQELLGSTAESSDRSAILAATARLLSIIHVSAPRGKKRPMQDDWPSLAAIQAIHALVGCHAQPAVRHEAYRVLCAAGGTEPSLLPLSDELSAGEGQPIETTGPAARAFYIVLFHSFASLIMLLSWAGI
jgi:hypothetical protein